LVAVDHAQRVKQLELGLKLTWQQSTHGILHSDSRTAEPGALLRFDVQ
jgi:hypothetical protein